MDLIFENTLCPSERRRCRHCNGCIYFDIVDHYGCCDYFLRTGLRRPGKFAQPDCPVKQYPLGYKQNAKIQEFICRVDAEEELKDKLAKKKQNAKPAKRGRKPTWDTEYGLLLYQKGYYYFEIAEILDTTIEKVQSVASDNFWVNHLPPDTVRHRHDIEDARIEYELWRKNKNKQEAT